MPVTRTFFLIAVFAASLASGSSWKPAAEVAPTPAPTIGLSPTAHPPIPRTLADAWLVPDASVPVPPAWRAFEAGARAFDAGDYPQALTLLADAGLARSELGGYAAYLAGLAQLKLARADQARDRFARTTPTPAPSALVERWNLASAEAAELSGNPGEAADLYTRVLDAGATEPPVVLARLVAAATAAGDGERADAARLRLYAEHPTSPEASDVAGRVAEIRSRASVPRAQELDALELARAERLYAAGRYKDARATFGSVQPSAADARDRVALRIGQSDYFLKHYRAAADQLATLTSRGEHQAEARHFHALALRRLGRTAEYEAAARQLADEFPGTSWAEDALNSLASYYIIDDRDDVAVTVFERILREYPAGRHAERAAWKVGWWRYRKGEFPGAIAVFERAAAAAPRSDYRPAWLYWAGRARAQAGDAEGARTLLGLTVTDYQNSYYGRLAVRAMGNTAATAGPRASRQAPAAPPRDLPPTSGLIRALIATGQHELARREIEFARRAWGASPVLDATLAYVHTRLGDLRRGAIYMKRAYPQYLAAGGDELPTEVRRIIFPIAYADLIATYSKSRGLEPALVSALIAQESAFQADVRSSANAIGLMQILPRTGRRLARQDGLRRFSSRMLVDPKVNVRLGTRYFAQLVDEFPGVHFALASYNAGESRVRQWRAERGPMATDEFIDDIPFPETQGYVKRILSMVEDYRDLYGPDLAAARTDAAGDARAAKPAL